MRCIRAGVPDFGAWMHYGPRPRDADRGRGCAVRSVAAAAAATCVAATLLVLEVRDHLLDLGLVLRLAGLLDQLRRDARSDELPDHACHVRLRVVDCLLGAPTNGRPTAFPTRSAGRAVVDVAGHPAEVGVAGTRDAGSGPHCGPSGLLCAAQTRRGTPMTISLSSGRKVRHRPAGSRWTRKPLWTLVWCRSHNSAEFSSEVSPPKIQC